MAKAYTTWTVLNNRPIQKHADNLWSVAGLMANGKTQRRMVIARLDDGRLVVHNAIALDDAGMAEIDAWGKVAAIVVPNAFHRQDARIWKDRYPTASVYCPGGATKKVEQVVPVDGGDYNRAPADDQTRLYHLEGVGEGEGVLEVRSATGVTLVFNDSVLNMPDLGLPVSLFLAPMGRPSVPRFFRWMMTKDKAAFTRQLERLADTPNLERLVFGHGKDVTEDPAGVLRAVAAEARG